MKTCAKCRIGLPVEGFARKSKNTDGLQENCRICNKIYADIWRAKNLERKRQMDRDYAAKNAEQARAKTRAWVIANPERKRASDKTYAINNAERLKEQGRAYRAANASRKSERDRIWRRDNPEAASAQGKAYRVRNRGSVLADRAFRKARKKQATPAWLTKEHRVEMRNFYKNAVLFSEIFGEPFHVDHIVPLLGENVRGLHVPWNLQVLPAKENMSKGNRLE